MLQLVEVLCDTISALPKQNIKYAPTPAQQIQRTARKRQRKAQAQSSAGHSQRRKPRPTNPHQPRNKKFRRTSESRVSLSLRSTVPLPQGYTSLQPMRPQAGSAAAHYRQRMMGRVPAKPNATRCPAKLSRSTAVRRGGQPTWHGRHRVSATGRCFAVLSSSPGFRLRKPALWPSCIPAEKAQTCKATRASVFAPTTSAGANSQGVARGKLGRHLNDWSGGGEWGSWANGLRLCPSGSAMGCRSPEVRKV